MELRNDYGNPDVGACWESLVGGNHLRLWRQNGPKAHTNALFLAYVNQSVSSPFSADCMVFPYGQCFRGKGESRNFGRGTLSLFNVFSLNFVECL
jgi:hypothetical protein